MISVTTLIMLLGFHALYNTSKRAPLYNTFKMEKWFQRNENSGKIIGITLLFIPFIILINIKGVASGILIWFIMLMMIGSLTIIIAPFRIINYKTLSILFLTVLILEIFIK